MRTWIFESLAGFVALTLAATLPVWADVPAPPANQSLGMADVLFGDLQEADCRSCHDVGVPARHHALEGQPIPPGSLVPYPDADGNGSPDTTYGCTNCHGDPLVVERDCTVCHVGASPHHATAAAQAGDCKACHGDFVDNMGDGHSIPSYATSLVTPFPSGGTGLPLNSRGNGAGACNYCHDNGLLPSPIRNNRDLHHGTGLSNCSWCHDFSLPKDEQIRVCEGCHGPDSLHNIQADSPNAANLGMIVVGSEDAGYGHIGKDVPPDDSDCWGCHGFPTMAPAPLDSDGDGVPDDVENAAPNGGDGNGDGTQDSVQAAVASLPTADGGSWLTVSTTPGCALRNVATAPLYIPDMILPFGGVSFALPYCPTSRLTLLYHGSDSLSAPPFAYVRRGPNPPGGGVGVYMLSQGPPHNTTFGSMLVGSDPTVAVVQFTLTDGVIGDDTPAGDGIFDIGGPGFRAVAAPALTPGGIALAIIVLLAIGWWQGRKTFLRRI